MGIWPYIADRILYAKKAAAKRDSANLKYNILNVFYLSPLVMSRCAKECVCRKRNTVILSAKKKKFDEMY